MHAIQGDGEISGGGGIETGGTVNLRCRSFEKPEGMTWPRIINDDYIMTTALNDGTEYEGGELDIRLGSETYSHKLNKGECILFDPNLWHRGKPVTKGERRVCITWIQTLIQDVFIRELLYDYQDLEFYAMNAIDKDKWMHDVEPATYFNQIRYKLIRQYSSTYDD